MAKKKTKKKPAAKSSKAVPKASRKQAGQRRRKANDKPTAEPCPPIPLHDGERLSVTLSAPGIGDAEVVDWDVFHGNDLSVDGPKWLWYHDSSTTDTDQIHLYTLTKFDVSETSGARRGGFFGTGKLTITIKSTLRGSDGKPTSTTVVDQYEYDLDLQP